MDVSSAWAGASVCCTLDEVHPPKPPCYWNVSSLAIILSKTHDFTLLTSLHEIPCSENSICYTDVDTVNKSSNNFFVTGANTTNEIIYGGLSCNYNDSDHCYEYNASIPGPEVLVGTCKLLSDVKAGVRIYQPLDPVHLYYMIMFFISLPFLVATFIVYTILPELHNLHGLILRSYILNYFMSYFWTVAALIKYMVGDLPCHNILDVAMFFAILATFFWLNVMCFDIWWTFRSMRLCKHHSTRKKFIVYSIYAWGSPTLLIAVGVIKKYGFDLPAKRIDPDPYSDCWLSGWTEGNLYIVGIVLFTLCLDTLFFILVVIEITRHKRNTAHYLEGNDSAKNNDEKRRFFLYLKLSVLMGMSWSINAIPFNNDYVKYILRIPTLMQGPILFLLFVCNDKTRRLLRTRLGWKDWKVTKWMEHAVSRIPTPARCRQVDHKCTSRSIEADSTVTELSNIESSAS